MQTYPQFHLTFLFAILLTTHSAWGQGNVNKIDLLDFLVLTPGATSVYQNQNNFSGESYLDTLELRSIHVREACYYYYVQNTPPMFFVNENFIKGAFRISSDSVFYFPVNTEAEILGSTANEYFLFPRFIDTHDVYSSKNIFQQSVNYQFFIPAEGDSSLNTKILGLNIKTENFLGMQSDTVLLSKGKGMVLYTLEGKSPKTLHKTFLNEKISSKTGELYINSFGDSLFEGELPRSYAYQSDFSTATYNRKRRLIREDFFGTTGDQGIKYITYTYDKKGKLIAERLYYTGNYDPDAELTGVWINEYYYNEKGQLIESRHKRDEVDESYYAIESYIPEGGITADDKRFSKRHSLHQIKNK